MAPNDPTPALRKIFALSVLLLSGGCADYSLDRASAPATFNSSPTDAVPDTTTSSTALDTGASMPDASLYSLSLSLSVQDGAPVSEGASLAVSLWALDPYAEDGSLHLVCSHAVPVLGITDESWAAPAISQPLFAWWSLSLDDGQPDAPCPMWEARDLWLGIGAYDPMLDPALAADGRLGFALYGLYLRETSDGPVYVIGVAGTAAAMLGEDSAVVEAPPLPDGAYEGHSLVMMSFDAP